MDVVWRTQELSKLQLSHIKVKDAGEATLGREESDGGEMLLPKVYLGRAVLGRWLRKGKALQKTPAMFVPCDGKA